MAAPFQIVITHGAGTLTLDNSSNATRLIGDSLVYNRQTNYPAKVEFELRNDTTSTTDNLLSSSFNGWSAGTGAIAIGDYLTLKIGETSYATGAIGAATTTWANVFITDLQQTDNGRLKVTAYDNLKKLDYNRTNKIKYNSYRDRYDLPLYQVASGADAGKLAIQGVDSNGYYPGVAIEVFGNDNIFAWGLDILNDTGTDSVVLPAHGDKYAQSFIFENDAVFYGAVYAQSDTSNEYLSLGIQGDDGSDRPDGTDIYNDGIYFISSGAFYWWVADWTTSNYPSKLEKGKKYWVVATNQSLSATFTLRRNSAGEYKGNLSSATGYFYDSTIPSWAAAAGNGIMAIQAGDYVKIPPSDYHYYLDGATHALVFDRFPSALDTIYSDWGYDAIFGATSYSNTYRGRVSYYYDTVVLNNVISALVNLEPGMSYNGDANIDMTIPLYRARGKSIGDCLRELADLYGYNDSGTYNQIAFMAHPTSDYIYAGRRKNITDDTTAAMTFAYGRDSATDNYARIVSCDLKMSSRLRPATVQVVGKSADGAPLIATRDDRGLGATSFRTLSGITNTETIYDETLTTLEDVNNAAYRLLDKYKRNVWEGTITVVGVYPQLFQNATAGIEGSGDIIKLYYSPLGISNTLFYVQGITVRDNTTEILLTNDDVRTNNILLDASRRSLSSESFLSPTDPQTTYYVSVYKTTAVTDSTTYMQLCKADNTILDAVAGATSSRVLCTKLTNPTGVTDYNTNTYNAVFDYDNGYGTVERIELYSDATGGSQLAEFDFSSEIDSEAEFYKSKTMRVIVDFHCEKS